MSNNEIRFTHVRKPRLNYTIAYTFDHDTAANTFEVSYGIAQCGKGDTFVRKTGRMIATKRLEKGNSGNFESLYYGKFTIPATPGLLVTNVIQQLFENERRLVLEEYQYDMEDMLFAQHFAQMLSQ